MPVGALGIGNAIVTRAGPSLIVKSIVWHRRTEGYQVYNFEVEPINKLRGPGIYEHSYFVGYYDGGVCVHNAVYGGEVGSYLTLKKAGSVGDQITPHHMPQAAQGFTPYNDGGAINLPEAEHILTRTYGGAGNAIKNAESGLPFRTVFGRDLRDMRRLFGSRYDDSLKGLISFYRAYHPNLIARPPR